MTHSRQNLVAPILTFSVWMAGFAWMVLHFGAVASPFGG
jgi:hypothetical protein